MDDSIVGTRIRQHRRQSGITQSDLATQVGISPSYLNLIEWNKRRVKPELLTKIAHALAVPTDGLDGASEQRLHESLHAVANLDTVAPAAVELERTGELIGRFPGWARALGALAHAQQEAHQRAQVLSERLSNDPYLSETVHHMLSRIAAVRSAAEILVDYDDLTEHRRRRFNTIISEESQILSEVGEALASYLDKTEDTDRVLTPMDEVEAFCAARDNHFDELERAAEALAPAAESRRPVSRLQNARDQVRRDLNPAIDALLAGETTLKTEAARKRARDVLADYATGAILMPLNVFSEQAAAVSYDIEALADVFSVDVESICHRLTALPRDEAVPHFGFVQANAAGTIVKMLNLEGLSLPRYAAACPLWALYRAQQSPETVIRQRVVFPSGARFVFVARARHVGVSGFGKPRHYVTDMIAMTEADAQRTVYRPETSAPVEEVGASCRLCSRVTCAHRVADPLTQ